MDANLIEALWAVDVGLVREGDEAIEEGRNGMERSLIDRGRLAEGRVGSGVTKTRNAARRFLHPVTVSACFSLLRRRVRRECVWVVFKQASSFLEDIIPLFLHIHEHGLGVYYNKVFYRD